MVIMLVKSEERRKYNMVNILLACGIGASTGFMAANMRKVAKKNGIEAKISAVSKSQIHEFVDEIDILLLGPHFASEVEKYKVELEKYNIKVMSINPEFYALLDGENILNDALNLIK